MRKLRPTHKGLTFLTLYRTRDSAIQEISLNLNYILNKYHQIYSIYDQRMLFVEKLNTSDIKRKITKFARRFSGHFPNFSRRKNISKSQRPPIELFFYVDRCKKCIRCGVSANSIFHGCTATIAYILHNINSHCGNV